jgi:hypothetical protein
MKRPEFNPDDLEKAFSIIRITLNRRLEEKGKGIYMSSHEINGIIDEEVDEFKDEVRNNDGGGQYEELIDVAVGCIFGMASISSGKMDWL